MLRKLALAVVSFAVTLGVLEMGVRLAHLEVNDHVNEMRKYGLLLVRDPAGYFRHPPGASAVLQRVTMRFNSLGVRVFLHAKRRNRDGRNGPPHSRA